MENLYLGKYNSAESSKEITVGKGNFMWHGMMSHLYFNRSIIELNSIVNEIQRIKNTKATLIEKAVDLINNFHWTHMMEDNSNATTKQRKKEEELKKILEICTEDMLKDIYVAYIHKALIHSMGWKSPMSYDKFVSRELPLT
jgi:hypothetical protein